MKKFVENSEIFKGNGSIQEIWENVYKAKEWGRYPKEDIVRFIARNFYGVENRSKINILELGLGTGANLWYCANEGFRVSGIEYSQTGASRFIERLEKEGLKGLLGEVKIGDYYEKLDEFEENSFDAWIDSYSLAYNDMDRTKAIIEKAVSKLKIGGKFISVTPSLNDAGYSADSCVSYHLCQPANVSDGGLGAVRYCDDADIAKLYNGENYKITQISRFTRSFGTIIENDLFIVEGVREK